MLDLLIDLKNTVDFWLRRHLRWQRKGYSETSGNNLFLFASAPELFRQETVLLKNYPALQILQARCEATRYQENLNLLCLLDATQNHLNFEKKAQEATLHCLEIGFKNWSTLPALVIFLAEHWQGPIEITGVEIDLWRVYQDGHSRYDALMFHIEETQKLLSRINRDNIRIEWQESDIREHQAAPYDFILWALPFIFEEPHQAWGLPKRYFNPQACIEHVFSKCLKQGGLMLSSHQGELEATQHQLLLKNVSTRPEITLNAIAEQPFLEHRYPRYAQITHRDPKNTNAAPSNHSERHLETLRSSN